MRVLVSASLILLCACATPAPAARVAEAPPPRFADGYQLTFPAAPDYERAQYQASAPPWGEVDLPLHRFRFVAIKVQYLLEYVTIPQFRELGDPKSIQKAVEANLARYARESGVRILATEAIELQNTEFAKSFVGTNQGQTVAGFGCAAGDRLYVVATEVDQSVPAQVRQAAAFRNSFRP